jgi:hypothetical protein
MGVKKRSDLASILSLTTLTLGLTLAMAAEPARAGTIYFQNQLQNGNELWSMNDNGTGLLQLCAAGANVGGAVSGQTYGSIPGTTIPARRFLIAPKVGTFIWTYPGGTRTIGYGELFYFTPDGQGGQLWTQITSFFDGGWVITPGATAAISNDGQDTFISVTVIDSTTSPITNKIVRIHVNGVDPGGTLVTPADPRVEVVLTHSDTATFPYTSNANMVHSWSADGDQFVYLLSGSSIQLRLKTIGGADTLLGDSSKSGLGYFTPTWSPDSENVAFCSGANIYVINTASAAVTLQVQGNNAKKYVGLSNPAWSPDGGSFAVQIQNGAYAYFSPTETFDVGRVAATKPTTYRSVTNLTGPTMPADLYGRISLGWR